MDTDAASTTELTHSIRLARSFCSCLIKNAPRFARAEILHSNGDHSMTVLHRMWLPKPHKPRDMIFKQVWKRLNDDTICIAVYDDSYAFLSTPVSSSESTVRASKLAIMLFEGVPGKVSERSERAFMKTRAMNQHPRNGYRHNGYFHY